MNSNKDRKEAPDFFKVLKEKFVNQLLEMGFEFDQIDDYLEENGLCELNHDMIASTIGLRKFNNKLYQKEGGD